MAFQPDAYNGSTILINKLLSRSFQNIKAELCTHVCICFVQSVRYFLIWMNFLKVSNEFIFVNIYAYWLDTKRTKYCAHRMLLFIVKHCIKTATKLFAAPINWTACCLWKTPLSIFQLNQIAFDLISIIVFINWRTRKYLKN